MPNADTLTVIHDDDTRTDYTDVRYQLHRDGIRIWTADGETLHTDVLMTQGLPAAHRRGRAQRRAAVTTSTSGGLGEVAGLTQSIAYAQHLAAEAGLHSPAGNESYLAHLAAARVTGAGLTTGHDMQAAFAAAAAAAAAHAAELGKQTSIQEQYNANPDAGDKDFQTGDTGGGTGSPATRSNDVRTAMTASSVRNAADEGELPDEAGLADTSSQHWHGSDVVTAESGDGAVSVGLYQQPDTGPYVVVATNPAGQQWEPDSTANGIDPSLNPQEARQLADTLDDLVALAQSGTATAAPTKLEKLAARVRGLLGDSGVTIVGDEGEIEVSAADIRALLDAAAPEPVVATRRKVAAKACGQEGMDTGTVWAQLDTSGPEPVVAVTSTEGNEQPEDYPDGYTTTRLSLDEAGQLAGQVRRFADVPEQAEQAQAEPPAPEAAPRPAPAEPRQVVSPRGRTYEYDPGTGATAVIEPDGWRAVVPPTSTTGIAARLLYWRAEIQDGRGEDATVEAGRALLSGLSAAELRELADSVGASAQGARTKGQLVDAIVNMAIGAPRKYRGLSKW